jgi:hypothetical protein
MKRLSLLICYCIIPLGKLVFSFESNAGLIAKQRCIEEQKKKVVDIYAMRS